jgi:hypothetical protein
MAQDSNAIAQHLPGDCGVHLRRSASRRDRIQVIWLLPGKPNIAAAGVGR